MRILAIGDVTSTTAADYLASVLWDYRKREKIDLVIANAENAGFITGTSAETARKLLLGGVDCLTGGNHTMRNRSVHTYLDEESSFSHYKITKFQKRYYYFSFCRTAISGISCLTRNNI